MLLSLSAVVVVISAGTIVMAQSMEPEGVPEGKNEKPVQFDPSKMPPPPMKGQDQRGPGHCPMMGQDQRGPGACGMQMMPPPPPMMDKDQRGPGCHMPPHEMGKGHGPVGMNPMAMLEIENPEKAKELEALKESKPEEFRKAVKAATDELFEKQKKEREEFGKLLDQYRKNPSDELKAQIRAKVAAQFEKKMKVEEKMLSRMEEDLKKSKERLEKQKSLKDQLVDLKLGNIVFEQDLRW